MSGTNPVGTYAETLSAGSGAMTPPTWFGQADANSAVLMRHGDNFAPHPAATPAMSVVVDAGHIVAVLPNGQQVVTEAAKQTVTIGAAPSSPNSRIDLVVVDAGTGSASVVAGAPGGTPVAPAMPAGKIQIAQVAVSSGTVAIVSTSIYDLRATWLSPMPGLPWAVGGGTGDAITATYAPAIVTLTDGLVLAVRAPGANATTTPKFSPNGLTAQTITKQGGQALAVGDIGAQYVELLLRYNLAFARWELASPLSSSLSSLTSAAIAAALGYTPQNAASGPTGAQIAAGLGYTPANKTAIGGMSGTTLISGNVTLMQWNRFYEGMGAGIYNVTCPSVAGASGSRLFFYAAATCTLIIAPPSGVSFVGANAPSASVIGLSPGGFAEFWTDGVTIIVAVVNTNATGGGVPPGGGGEGSS